MEPIEETVNTSTAKPEEPKEIAPEPVEEPEEKPEEPEEKPE
jgi:hypothetical protein